jgi:cytoskeletal protein RodZ
MIEDKRNIDLLFEEKLRTFGEPPPAYSWDRLEKDLSRVKSVRRQFYFRLAAASLLILLAFGAGYFYATFQSGPSEKISQEFTTPDNPSDIKQITEPEISDLNNTSIKKELASSPQNSEPLQSASSPSQKKKDNEQVIVTVNDENAVNILIAESEIHENKASESGQESPEVNAVEDHENQTNQIEKTIALKPDEPDIKDVPSDYKPLVLDPDAKEYGLESSKSKELKWSVGAQVAPVLSYRDISINYANQSGNNFKETESQLNENEDALLTYAGGIDINYCLNNRWSVQSGMYYSTIGQVNNNALNFRQENDQYLLFAIQTSTGGINITFEKVPDHIRKIDSPKDTLAAIDLNNVKIIQNFNLFEVPFMIRYKIMDKKLGINVSGGLSPAYLVNNSTVLQVDGNKYDIGNSSNLNNMIFNTSISLGINFAISNKLGLNLEPNFKYSLSPINKNSQFDYHPYYFSFFTGVNYKF